MKKMIIKWLIPNRGQAFTSLFSESEQTAIINALWHRSKSEVVVHENIRTQNDALKLTCKRIAMELSEAQ